MVAATLVSRQETPAEAALLLQIPVAAVLLLQIMVVVLQIQAVHLQVITFLTAVLIKLAIANANIKCDRQPMAA